MTSHANTVEVFNNKFFNKYYSSCGHHKNSVYSLMLMDRTEKKFTECFHTVLFIDVK